MDNNVVKKKHGKLIIFIVMNMLIIAGLVLYFGIMRPYKQVHLVQDIKIDGVYISPSTEINDFTLTDQNAHLFTKENLKGHWTMMFFGFTSCPKICPITMVTLKKMYTQLNQKLNESELPQIVFVTVDPDTDTLARVKDYVSSFHPNFIGTRADIKETIKLENQLHIVAAKLQLDEKGKNRYTINHSTEILLFNPHAEVQAYFSYPHESAQMIKDYMTILESNKGRTWD